MNRLIAVGAVSAAVGILNACTAGQLTSTTATVTTALGTAQSDLATAVKLYGIGKGLALAAEAADPALAPALMKATAIGDAAVATATAALNSATADAASLEALAAQLVSQANAITLAAAPAVKVVPSATAP